MRHANAFRKFSRTPAHRRALLRNLVTSMILKESCETTVEKAKELRPIVERLVTLGRSDNLHSRRKALDYLFDKKAVHKLFADLGPRFKARPGGYTRIVRTRYRHGDAAALAVIEFVEKGKPVASTPKEEGSSAKEAAPKAEKKAQPKGKKAASGEAKKAPAKKRAASSEKE